MSKRILRITEVWGTDTEEEANQLIEEKVKECDGDVTKKLVERRTKKAKGVIVAEAYRATIQVDYNEIFGDYDNE